MITGKATHFETLAIFWAGGPTFSPFGHQVYADGTVARVAAAPIHSIMFVRDS